MAKRWLAAVALGACASCFAEAPLDRIAARYVFLAMALDVHDAGYVDAKLVERPEPEALSLEAIEAESGSLLQELGTMPEAPRARFLIGQLDALRTRASVLAGARLSFGDEMRGLYGVELAPLGEPITDELHASLDRVLGGEGALLDRYSDHQARGGVDRDGLMDAARAALDECRRRTLQHVELPQGESVEVELAYGKDWAAYHRYLGGLRSVVQISAELVWTPRDLLESVCHESYPGHHTLTVLAETELVERRGLVEYSVQTLHSPYGWHLEELAVRGVDLVLSDSRDDVDRLSVCLRPLAAEGARRYLERRLDRVGTVLWLERHALMRNGWAYLRFVDRYRGYAMAYGGRSWNETDPWKEWGELARGKDEAL